MCWKKSLLVICKILGLFVNTLIDDHKCCLLNRDYWTQPIQMLLSKEQKIFSQFFSAFRKSGINVKHFQKKGDPQSLCMSKITACEGRGLTNSSNVPFRRPFDKRHDKRSQTLLKSARRHLYHIFWSVSTQLSWKNVSLINM